MPVSEVSWVPLASTSRVISDFSSAISRARVRELHGRLLATDLVDAADRERLLVTVDAEDHDRLLNDSA